MLAEFFEKLKAHAREGMGVKVIDRPDLPNLLLWQGDERWTEPRAPRLRVHKLFDLDSLYELLANKEIATAPEVFVGANVILVTLNEGRREVATLPFVISERWAKLRALAQRRTMPVPEVVKLLRYDLVGGTSDALLQSLRRIDFSRRSDGSVQVDHGRESLGKAVEAVVQQAQDVPESFAVHLPIVSNRGFRALSAQTVTCGVYIDVQHEGVQVFPLPDEIEAAQAAFLENAVTELRQNLDGIPVLVGEDLASKSAAVELA